MDKYNSDGGTYDEPLAEVISRVRVNGCMTKLDLLAMITWKRIRTAAPWVYDLLTTQDAKVRDCTEAAFQPGLSDQQRIDALKDIPGCRGGASMATVALCAYDPVEFGIMDDRALDALEDDPLEIDLHRRRRGLTLRYLIKVRELRDMLAQVRTGVTARNLDQALFVIGDPKRRRVTGPRSSSET
ncbi:MAG: hypothetical protein ACLP7J_20470 [Streptosporangiaceae bacterium]